MQYVVDFPTTTRTTITSCATTSHHINVSIYCYIVNVMIAGVWLYPNWFILCADKFVCLFVCTSEIVML